MKKVLSLTLGLYGCIAQGLVSRYPGLKCNGIEGLCDRRFDDVSFLFTRASFAVIKKGSSEIGTQYLSIKEQLEAGVGAIGLSVFPDINDPSTLNLCFGDCNLYNGGPLSVTLSLIAEFLNQKKDHILTIFLDNPGNASTEAIQQAFIQSGLTDMIYTKPLDQKWDTLGFMVSTNKRLLVFENLINAINPPIPWVTNYRDNILKLSTKSDYKLEKYDCGPYGEAPTKSIVVVPHLNLMSTIVNGVEFDNIPNLQNFTGFNDMPCFKHVSVCRASTNFSWMNFIEVDFYEKGFLDRMCYGLNSIPYPGESVSDYLPHFPERTAPDFSKALVSQTSRNYPYVILNILTGMVVAMVI